LHWGRKFGAQERISVKFKKSNFLGFTTKPLPIQDFGVHHWKDCKNYNQQQKTTTFRTFSTFFVNICSNFHHILAIFRF